MKIDINDQLEKLQKRPYQDRIKILWTVVAVCAVILLGIWIFSLKHTFSNIGNVKSLVQTQTAATNQALGESQTQFAAVERVEKTGDTLKIYFNLDNPTDDILNVSNVENITLNVSGSSLNPNQVSDRQGQPFVQKILSHTKNFGVLTFNGVNATSGKLTFDQMFLDNSPANPFKQTLNLDFNKLNDSTKVRN